MLWIYPGETKRASELWKCRRKSSNHIIRGGSSDSWEDLLAFRMFEPEGKQRDEMQIGPEIRISGEKKKNR